MRDKKSSFTDDKKVVDIETKLPGQSPEIDRMLFNTKEEEEHTFLKDFGEKNCGDGKYIMLSDNKTFKKLGCSHKSGLDFDRELVLLNKIL